VCIISNTLLCFVSSFKLEGFGFTLFILLAYEVPNKLLTFNINYVRVKTVCRTVSNHHLKTIGFFKSS